LDADVLFPLKVEAQRFGYKESAGRKRRDVFDRISSVHEEDILCPEVMLFFAASEWSYRAEND
jgi:hypothetical protein